MAKAVKQPPTVEVPVHQFKWGHGFELRDVMSGYKGYVIYRVDNITGCDNYGLQSEGKDGEKAEHQMFDANRLEFTGKIKTLPAAMNTPRIVEKPGGLHSPITQHKIK